MKARVRPTPEITVSETPAYLKRRMHKDINVALIDISRWMSSGWNKKATIMLQRCTGALQRIYTQVPLEKSSDSRWLPGIGFLRCFLYFVPPLLRLYRLACPLEVDPGRHHFAVAQF